MDQEFHRLLVRRQVSVWPSHFPVFNSHNRGNRRADLASFHLFPASAAFRVIEENTLKSCPDLIVECVTVGNGRPSPVLLIELGPGATALGSVDSVKREVYRRIRHFQSRRLSHERIGSVESLVVVQRSAWPRSPTGHIRRTDAEQKFQRELDRAYAATSGR